MELSEKRIPKAVLALRLALSWIGNNKNFLE